MKQMLDLYSDYLLASFSQTSATGLSNLMNGEISHDQVTRFLSQEKKTSKDLWLMVKPFVKKIQSKEGVLIIDDSIEEKPYTDENEIVCWHYDHSKERNIKGINFLSTLYHNQEVSLPIGFRLIAKTEAYVDKKTQKIKRRSPVTKNEMAREMILQAVKIRFFFASFCLMSGFPAAKILSSSKTIAKKMSFVQSKLIAKWRSVWKTN